MVLRNIRARYIEINSMFVVSHDPPKVLHGRTSLGRYKALKEQTRSHVSSWMNFVNLTYSNKTLAERVSQPIAIAFMDVAFLALIAAGPTMAYLNTAEPPEEIAEPRVECYGKPAETTGEEGVYDLANCDIMNSLGSK